MNSNFAEVSLVASEADQALPLHDLRLLAKSTALGVGIRSLWIESSINHYLFFRPPAWLFCSIVSNQSLQDTS